MSSGFSRDVVEYVARLARLRLSAEEVDRFADQLARVLDYAEQVREVDTTGVDPTFQVAGGGRPLRDDEVRQGLDPAEALGNAPDADREAGLFKVPRVLG
jgi:aspartyl-tRNA(Asn)/glutamyl-tRNA(Gln) amidotransferase subunit C